VAGIELNDIRERIRKLQELEKVMSDPAMAILLNEVLAAKNANNTAIPANTQHEYKANKKGTLVEGIERICMSFPLERQFTIKDVVEAYEQAGNIFIAKDKAIAAYGAMQRLVARGTLSEHKGVGKKPTIYQRMR